MTENIVWHDGSVSRSDRSAVTGGPGMTVWMTGLSGSGKSTIAAVVEAHLVRSGRAVYSLDGDNVRHGLNADLGFSAADRTENIRRVGEVARLMADAGLVVLVPVISPYRKDRDAARRAHEDAGLRFIEVHIATPLDVCEDRDPKGLYARARAGDLPNFTGIDAPYEEPESPDLRVDTGTVSSENAAASIIGLIDP
ncbi:MAG: adenylyl-sulfate kinase [Actinomycetia bacterium]|nr:adenylyl-sulfate kinase [bacterium]MCP4961993.1 adenylyl-sulfate kinase [Actinomycetes bacterium]